MTCYVRCTLALATVLCLLMVFPVSALERIVISTPGPRSLSFLPIDLIPKIGADREQGVALQIIYTGSGAASLRDLATRNTDFAIAGVPAAMSARLAGDDVMVIAPIDDAPIFVLMVRTDLQDQVKSIADLKGRVIAVNASASSRDTASKQLARLLLEANGVSFDSVHIIPTGQNWHSVSALILSGTADAIVGNEPFASRLKAAGLVFFLANLAEPKTVQSIKGAHFLHAALLTRNETIAQTPEKVAKVVAMLQRSLDWLLHHTPEQVAETLGVTDPLERDSLILCLHKYPSAYSQNGRFSSAQLQETELFFHTSGGTSLPPLRLEDMVYDQWAGRSP